jgi:protein required for attachment to host cells
MSDLWVLVAESSEARIYAAPHARSPLTLVDTLAHEASRQHPRDLGTDVPGRVHDRFGPARHSMDVSQRVRSEERHRFARQIAARLDEARQRNRFSRLVVMSGPAFLGVLRECFSKRLTEAVVGEVAKDLVDQDAAAIQAHLPEGLAG